tara:strand:- start:118 stop:684 length:567 start_codon:yes stop_codon:yes gene_type:complete
MLFIKKSLILFTVIFSLSYSQGIHVHGMMANSGESSMGVYLNTFLVNVEWEDADPIAALELSYFTDSDIELGLSYIVEYMGEDFHPISLSVFKHFKSDQGWSKEVGLNLANVSEEGGGEMTPVLEGGVYSSDKLYAHFMYDLDAEEDEISFSLGKSLDLGGLVLGFSYSANLSYADEGWLGLTLGSNF